MSGEPGKLLVVDDDPRNRDMLSRRLARKGFDVSESPDGESALAFLAEHPIDLVLLDVMMPGMNGLEVLSELRKEHSLADLPVIMATAKSESEDIVEALKLGANDYVTKPIDFAVALARIETQLSLRRAIERIRNLEADLAEKNRNLERANGQLTSSNQRMRRDLEAAARIQQAFLPPESPQIAGGTVRWRYRPCDELGGDFLNVFQLDARHIGLMLIDVSGHGVPAALLSVTLSRLLSPLASGPSLLWREDAASGEPRVAVPAEVAGDLVERFPRNSDTGQYFTFSYGLVDLRERRFSVVCAGHPGPVHLSSGAGAEVVNAVGAPIGLLPVEVAPRDYAQVEVELGPGDRLLFYSDGVPEAEGPEEEEFGRERLCTACARARDAALDEGLDRLLAELEQWRGGDAFADDVSLLAFELAGS
ncbi:MAG TPA: SpoIIE family protein phosphatase [Thermoanaerobaculia bacterium]|nr:SpoIIE family protein phosphatase [Thermoanaerobaculia bacterium]